MGPPLIHQGTSPRTPASEGLNLNPSTPPFLATVTLNGTLDCVLLVPGLRLGQSHDATDALTLPGGKGINVARAAHTLNKQVLVTGLVAGQRGQRIRLLLAQMGLPDRLFSLPYGESRTSTILVDPARGSSTVLHHGGPTVQPDTWPVIRSHILAAVQGYRWVALCGSCPTGLPDAVYADLCARLRARGQRVCLDTRDEWLRAALVAQPHVVKCNQHEASRAFGYPVETPAQARDAARQWVELGIERVVITLGARGAVAVDGPQAWHIVAPPVKALSTVGSGDAATAGLIVALDCGCSLPDATRYAVVLGTANALVLGSACYDREAIPGLLNSTQVTSIDKAARPPSEHATLC